MKYILWDIDATLIKTGFAGLKALEQTLWDLYSLRVDVKRQISPAGRTDQFIAQELLKLTNPVLVPDEKPEHVRKLLNYYEQLLPKHLASSHGLVLPNVVATLDFMRAHPDKFTLTILTGNIYSAAVSKLKHYALIDYFDMSLGAFGDEHISRNALAETCLSKISRLTPSPDIIVIGDTVHDIDCAKHINARCMAVATGSTPLKTLQEHTNWLAVDILPDIRTWQELM